MPLYDISVSLSEFLPTFPDDPPLVLVQKSGPFAVTSLSLGSHSGTHLDLPGHLGLAGPSAAELPFEQLVGPCQVWDLSKHRGPIDAKLLARQPAPSEPKILLRTGNSRLWQEPNFCADYQALTAEGAAWLIEQGIELVGIDYLSIEAATGDGTVHRLLLEAGLLILEGLDLSRVPAGCYELICLPLKLASRDGAPCRAVLRGL
jgi:arylformamidase